MATYGLHLLNHIIPTLDKVFNFLSFVENKQNNSRNAVVH